MTCVFDWTPDAIDQLRALIAEGHSASGIAARMGRGMTRNMIIGKAYRLGLRIGGGNTSAAPASPKPPRAAFAKVIERRPPMKAMEVVETVFSLPPSPDAAPRKVTLFDLRAGVCRWPLGDPRAADFAYCGADCDLTSAYCPAHRRLAYVPTPRIVLKQGVAA